MCGIVGIVGKSNVNQALYDGLTVLQHRGQDAAGIVTSHDGRLFLRKDNGLVRDVFQQRHMQRLVGHMGIGHVRYPTAGSSSSAEAQPFCAEIDGRRFMLRPVGPQRDGAALHIGDVVTTRRNHRGEDFTVANRELWTVRDVAEDGTLTLSGGTDQRTETIPAEYAAESVTLGYASTVYGAQGVTSRRAVTVLSEDTSAAQLYVGMTRGKLENRVLVAGGDE